MYSDTHVLLADIDGQGGAAQAADVHVLPGRVERHHSGASPRYMYMGTLLDETAHFPADRARAPNARRLNAACAAMPVRLLQVLWSGGCGVCRKIWALLQLHAKGCTRDICRVCVYYCCASEVYSTLLVSKSAHTHV
jgi:TAZ zinc finger